MAFKPMTMDGQVAAAKLLDKGWNVVHQCLKEVFDAFPFKRSDTGDYASARVQWERTPASRRHPGDRGVPPGALVFFDLTVSGTKDPRPGHIGISLGGDRFVSTDWPTRGRISVAKIADVEEAWRARYLGWTDVIGGHNVKVGKDPDAVVAGSRSYPYVKVVLDGLNLRKRPDTDADIITVIAAGTVIRTGRTSAGWTPVKVGTRYGWVKAEFAVMRYKHVRFSRLALRSKGTTLRKGAKVLKWLPKGKKVIVLGALGAYYRVRVGGRTAYVLKRGVK